VLAEDYLESGVVSLCDLGTQGIECIEHFGRELITMINGFR
jgi:hypothetical protein